MGIQTVEKLLTKILKNNNYHVFATKEVMSRVRGGNNSTEIRVSNHRVRAYRESIDLFVPLNPDAIMRHLKRISEKTIVMGESKSLDYEFETNAVYEIPFTAIAREIGNKLYTNTVATGAICGLFDVDKAKAADFVYKTFENKGDQVAAENKKAFIQGYDASQKVKFKTYQKSTEQLEEELLINGADAVALGAIYGGVNFVSSYPMSPSTTVLIAFAQRAKKLGLVVEQAEDEIAAINMACGASYAGGTAFATTSGGGLALMSEGISLAGIIETPVTIHIAQRPGPATGLPTRTEQGDLNLALYSGHGDFPRAIFAPATIETAFELSRHAVETAERFQIPSFILTDQYFVDSYYNVPGFEFKDNQKPLIVETSDDYKRYRLTENGISPRGIPGYGKGIVKVDSDEHDEMGHITESFDVRVDMVHKRMKKLEALKKHVLKPIEHHGGQKKVLLIGWGSTYDAIREAVENLDDTRLNRMQFEQVFPLPANLKETLEQFEQVIFIENNVTGQFAELVRKETGFSAFKQILKYNGMEFSVEELTDEIKKQLGEG